jgi:hypothetical protein
MLSPNWDAPELSVSITRGVEAGKSSVIRINNRLQTNNKHLGCNSATTSRKIGLAFSHIFSSGAIP